MRAAITIYSQTYTHKGGAFSVWSYLDDPDPKRSTLLFAFSLEGETVAGLPDRAEAVRKARRRLDELPAKSNEKQAVDETPPVIQEEHQQQQDLSRQPDTATQAQGELFA
jgi:hypothetical protein